MNDALYIAQFRTGMRDDSFNWLGGAAAAAKAAGSRTVVTSQNATVEIGSATLPPGGSVQIPVTVRNVSDGLGLGTYEVRVAFNRQVIRVDSVVAGSFANPTRNINNNEGWVLFGAYQTDVPGPTGDIIVAYLAVTAIGGSGSSTPLDLTINTLGNSDGGDIPATDVDGSVIVQ
ncbi:MAG: hypothetical protein HY673_18695 [Chloroflexi bacterium]|nr:hypothetical protein [Chloroflexota bacterium]